MSNKTRLQTNNTNLQSLIEKANALPDAGGGSGGSIDTCTLKFNGKSSVFVDVNYTAFENGKIVSHYIDKPSDNLVLEHVVCGTNIILAKSDPFFTAIPNNNFTCLYADSFFIYSTKASNGDVINIMIIENDF